MYIYIYIYICLYMQIRLGTLIRIYTYIIFPHVYTYMCTPHDYMFVYLYMYRPECWSKLLHHQWRVSLPRGCPRDPARTSKSRLH